MSTFVVRQSIGSNTVAVVTPGPQGPPGPIGPQGPAGPSQPVSGVTGSVQTNNGSGGLYGDAHLTYSTGGTGQLAVAADGTGFITVGSIPALAGDVRLHSTAQLTSRNNANNSDLCLLTTDASDNLYIGTDTAFTASKQISQMNVYSTVGGIIYLGNGATTRLRLDSNGVTLYNPGDPLIFGFTGASSVGTIRMAEGQACTYHATGAARDMWAFQNSGNDLFLGTDSAFTLNNQASAVHLFAAVAVYAGVAGTTRFAVTSSGIQAYSNGDTLTFGNSSVSTLDPKWSAGGHGTWTDPAGNVGQSQIIVQTLNANFTTTTTTATNTNHSISAAANEVWLVKFDLTMSCSSTGGYKLQISAPAGATVEGWFIGDGAAATYLQQHISAINTLGTAFGTGATTDTLRGWARVKVGGTAGNIQIGVASGTNGQTTTMFAGSSIEASIAVAV